MQTEQVKVVFTFIVSQDTKEQLNEVLSELDDKIFQFKDGFRWWDGFEVESEFVDQK